TSLREIPGRRIGETATDERGANGVRPEGRDERGSIVRGDRRDDGEIHVADKALDARESRQVVNEGRDASAAADVQMDRVTVRKRVEASPGGEGAAARGKQPPSHEPALAAARTRYRPLRCFESIASGAFEQRDRRRILTGNGFANRPGSHLREVGE